MARYIDADKLYAEMEDLYEHHIEMRNFSADGAVADCLDILVKQPTADVVEVKHGKWIFTDSSLFPVYRCSVCNKRDDGKTRFCPNCGAEMKEGDINENN